MKTEIRKRFIIRELFDIGIRLRFTDPLKQSEIYYSSQNYRTRLQNEYYQLIDN